MTDLRERLERLQERWSLYTDTEDDCLVIADTLNALQALEDACKDCGAEYAEALRERDEWKAKAEQMKDYADSADRDQVRTVREKDEARAEKERWRLGCVCRRTDVNTSSLANDLLTVQQGDVLKAEIEKLREALREIENTPTGCLADHGRIASAALPPSTGEQEKVRSHTVVQWYRPRADGLSEGATEDKTGRRFTTNPPRPLAESVCPTCKSRERKIRRPFYTGGGGDGIPCNNPWHICPTCGSNDPAMCGYKPTPHRHGYLGGGVCCPDPWHGCPTCGSDDPAKRESVRRADDESGMWWSDCTDPYHSKGCPNCLGPRDTPSQNCNHSYHSKGSDANK